MGKNLTVRYSITQFSYWAASTGATGFATTYLLGRGLSSGLVGVLLAAAGILSCLTQPLLASLADKASKPLLPQLILGLSGICMGCLSLQLLPGLPVLIASILYMVGIWCSDAIVPLMNALSVACNENGYTVNYGAARGIGAAASAIGSLMLGHIIARLGNLWMFGFLLLFRLISVVAIAGFPKARKSLRSGTDISSCSILGFFSRYRWYCVSLLGIAFLGMYHAMTENYMIAIMQRLGGNSSHVGTALFISSLSGAPVIFFFSFFRKRLADTVLLKLAALTFLVKSVAFCLAANISTIYLLQLLQITSYGFLGPVQVYYARSRVSAEDMIKGQAFITAAYSLGCSGGNFAGGLLLSLGVDPMLSAGIVMALLGTVIICLTVNRKDSAV